MAGRKQHYIPRALLKGFLIKRKGNDTQAWVFKNGSEPYSGSIMDIAAKRFFYSDLAVGGSKSLDDRITDYEGRLSLLLDELRNTADGDQVDSLVAAEVVAHLSIRGAYLREIFSHGMQELIAGASSLFSDQETARSLMGVDEREPTSLLLTEIDQAINKVKDVIPENLPVPLLRRLILFSIREDFNNLYGQIIPSFEPMLRQIASGIPNTMRDGHAKALGSGLAPDKRVLDLSGLTWQVHKTATSIVLPDCVAIGVNEDGSTTQPYLLTDVSRTGLIMVPLTSEQILIGRPPGIFAGPVAHFNKFAASCSATFFVSAEHSSELISLSDLVGSTAKSAITEIVSETLGSLGSRSVTPSDSSEDRKTSGLVMRSVDHTDRTVRSSESTTIYRVSFKNCATQNEAKRIAEKVGVIVNSLSASLKLCRLDEVIFAEDYAAALRDLDRGFEPEIPLETTRLEDVVGVAMSALVIRDGKRKSSIVMTGWLGHALVSEDDSDARRSAEHMLSAMLSQVAFSDLLESVFPSATTSPSNSVWDSLLYGPMDGVPMAYYAAWMSADIDPSAGASYREMVLSTLTHSKSIIDTERIAYADHGDLDHFLHISTSALGAVLTLVAKLIGHCDACNEPMFSEDDQLHEALKQLSLCGWIEVFGRDLRRVFSASGSWSSITELTSLGVHMERHLWRFLVFPWVNNEGQVRVEVPYVGGTEPETES